MTKQMEDSIRKYMLTALMGTFSFFLLLGFNTVSANKSKIDLLEQRHTSENREITRIVEIKLDHINKEMESMNKSIQSLIEKN